MTISKCIYRMDMFSPFHDPRRFGCWLWSKYDHALLEKLGPEPLSSNFVESTYGIKQGSEQHP